MKNKIYIFILFIFLTAAPTYAVSGDYMVESILEEPHQICVNSFYNQRHVAMASTQHVFLSNSRVEYFKNPDIFISSWDWDSEGRKGKATLVCAGNKLIFTIIKSEHSI